jgi:hypothetical protein
MSESKNTADYIRQALSAINLVEEPVSYQEYLNKKSNPVEDSEFDRDMEAEPTDHPDHEVNMAKSDMFKAMEYARDIYKMLERVSEQEGIEGWVAAKITKASDYLSSVKHYIEHEVARADMSGESIEEKAVSKSQQQAAGAALAAKRGDAPKSKLQGASKEMMKMSTKELEKFAGTKHKGLPKKKESIGESTMTDTNKEKLNEGIRIQTDSLEDSIALMTIMKNAGLDPQQMNIQQSPSMNAPAPDMTPDLPAEIPGEEPKDMPMDEPESEAFDNAPDEKFLDKDDYELKRNKVPNSKMGSASAKQGDNPLETIEEIAKQLNKEYELFKEGRQKDEREDMEADASDMSKEEFIKTHGEQYAHIWDRVQGQMSGDPQYDEGHANEDRASDSVVMAKLKQAVGGEEKLVSTLFSSAVQNNMDDDEFIDAASRMLNMPPQEIQAIIDNDMNPQQEEDSELEDILRLSGTGETMEAKKSKPDYLDFDKDGDKKEPMKKALADKKKK